VTPTLARLRSVPGPIAAAVLRTDQLARTPVVVRVEALHASHLHPLRAVDVVTDAQLDDLAIALETLTRERRAAPDMRLHHPRVYRRKRCGTCGRPVQRVAVAGRTVYFCPRCQPAD
jgi:formamidopyrimidine-DNA glycosylase